MNERERKKEIMKRVERFNVFVFRFLDTVMESEYLIDDQLKIIEEFFNSKELVAKRQMKKIAEKLSIKKSEIKFENGSKIIL